MLYVALLGYLCAPDVIIYLPKRLTYYTRILLHAIIFFILTVVSMFILLFVQTIETKQYRILTTTSTEDKEEVDSSTNTTPVSRLPPASPLQKAMTFPKAMQSTAAPPAPEIRPVNTGNWTWPTVTIVPPTAPMPAKTNPNFPSYVPPIIPKTWDENVRASATATTASAATTGSSTPSSTGMISPTAAASSPMQSSTPSPFSGGGSGSAKASPSPGTCVTVTTQETRDCIPLPPLAQPFPPKKPRIAPSPQEDDTTWIPVVVSAVNRNNQITSTTKHYSSQDWVQFFKYFSSQESLRDLLEKTSKDSNTFIQVMNRLTQYKEARDPAGAENYVNQQAI